MNPEDFREVFKEKTKTKRGVSYKICFEPQKYQEDTKGLSQKE